jgi:hypothetical protein
MHRLLVVYDLIDVLVSYASSENSTSSGSNSMLTMDSCKHLQYCIPVSQSGGKRSSLFLLVYRVLLPHQLEAVDTPYAEQTGTEIFLKAVSN